MQISDDTQSNDCNAGHGFNVDGCALDRIVQDDKLDLSSVEQDDANVDGVKSYDAKLHNPEQDSGEDEDGVKQCAVKCRDSSQGGVLLDSSKQDGLHQHDTQDNAKVLVGDTTQELHDAQLNDAKPEAKDIETFKSAYEVLKTIGREEDFMSVLSSLSNGTLHPSNIALHLMFDIGNLSQVSFRQVRYNKTSLDFWAIVHRLFKGKATRFFRGSMLAPQDTHEGKYNCIEKAKDIEIFRNVQRSKYYFLL